jgi:hypothetical protein
MMFSELLLSVETLAMWAFVWWAWRKVSYFMSRARRIPTSMRDALAVCAVMAGAFEHGVYNVVAWLFPLYLSATFGPLDSFFLTLFYVGAALWVIPPMWRRG